MPDDELRETLLDRRLLTVAAACAPDGRPPFDQLCRRSRRRRRLRVAGALAAVALVAGVPTVVLSTLRDHGGGTNQTLAAGGTADGLCDDARNKYAAWLAADRSRIDLRRLARSEPAGSYVPGPATLQAARAKAERIVAGTVTDVHLDAEGSRSTIRVDRTVKGPRAGDLVIEGYDKLLPPHNEPAGQVKTPTGSSPPTGVVRVPASLIIDPTAPLLLPGQRAVWLLEINGRGSLTVQAVAGQYVNCHGRMTATDGNGFAAEVIGLTEDQLLARLQD